PMWAASCTQPAMCARRCSRSGRRRTSAKSNARSVSVGAGGEAGVVQPGDFATGKAEHLRKNRVGVLAEARRRKGRQARHGAEIQRQTRHRICADAELLDLGEERVDRRAAWVVAHELDKILKRAPQHAAAGERLLDL